MPKAKSATKAKSVRKAKKAIPSKKLNKKNIAKKATGTKAKKVLAIPKGYNTVIPYLIMDGADKAIEFYKKVFGAKLGLKMALPNGKIGHAELKIGDSKIMLADEKPEFNTRSPKAMGGSPVTIQLYVKNVDKIVQKAIAGGAKLIRPVENMFYGDRCGSIEDQFGYQWHVSTHIEDVSTRELKKRAAQIYGNK